MSPEPASPPPGLSPATDYVPVSCSFHDVLEDAAVRRVVRQITYQDAEGVEHLVRSTIDDVWSRNGEEFARLGTGDVVRLDRLELGDEPHVATSPGGPHDPSPGRPERG
ncbi:MAG: hypothetical protein HKO53_01600 [Gemmatimonadetes bacterium]|nr:hypothetical protein [Gemmatimonadota bacterium]